VPYLRGFGATTYRDRSTLRSAEQAALASDVIDLLDSLGIPHCVVGGFDWGARGLCRCGALTRALPWSAIGRRSQQRPTQSVA